MNRPEARGFTHRDDNDLLRAAEQSIEYGTSAYAAIQIASALIVLAIFFLALYVTLGLS